jgi:hypothetical protein
MIILSYGKDTMRTASGYWIYEHWDLNPYQIKLIRKWIRRKCPGSAWQILQKYPFMKESYDGYFSRVCERKQGEHVSPVS